MRRSERAATLTELLIATTLAVIVVLGITSVDISRFRMHKTLSEYSGLIPPEYRRAALSTLHITKRLERADRVNLITPGGGDIQIRTPALDTDAGLCTGCAGTSPPPCCLDIPGNYRWDQYRFDPAAQTLRFYTDTDLGCGNVRELAAQLTSVAFQYRDRGVPPPGEEPFAPSPMDNNVLEFAVAWSDGRLPTPRTHQFPGEVTLRAAAYTDLNATCAGACDSGTALDPTGVAGPPALCP